MTRPAAARSRACEPSRWICRQILASDFWQCNMKFGEISTMAATMMQPVGGMGRIGQAFGRALHGVITYQAVVTRSRRTDAGARIVWRDAEDPT